MPAEPGEPLSEREIEVVRLVAAGYSNKEIAARLVVSPNTVKVHLRNIFAKTGVASRTELTVWALRQGWVALAVSEEKGPQATETPVVTPSAAPPASASSSASAPTAHSALLRGPEAAAPPSSGVALSPTEGTIPASAELPSFGVALSPTEGTIPASAELPSFGVALSPTEGTIPASAELPSFGVALSPTEGAISTSLHATLSPASMLSPTAEGLSTGGPTAIAPEKHTPVSDETAPGLTPSPLSVSHVKESRPEATETLLPLRRWPRHRWLALGLGWLAALFILLLPAPRPGESAPNPAPGLVDVPQRPGLAPSEAARWQELAPMSVRRARLAFAAWQDNLYAIGGLSAEGVTALTERYDPKQDVWETLTPRPLAAANIGAATLRTGLLVPGGCDAQGRPSADVHLYDPRTDVWRAVAPLPEARCGYAIAGLNDQVYLFGGWDGTRYTSTAYRYDATTDRWESLVPAPTARGFGSAVAYGQRVYYVGGYDGKSELATCEVYDVNRNAWESCARLLQPRGGVGLVVAGARLYAIGGGWQHYVGFNESYDPKTEHWTVVETPIVGEWRHAGVAVLGTSLYAVGGWNGDYLNRTYRFDALPFQIYIPVSLP